MRKRILKLVSVIFIVVNVMTVKIYDRRRIVMHCSLTTNEVGAIIWRIITGLQFLDVSHKGELTKRFEAIAVLGKKYFLLFNK